MPPHFLCALLAVVSATPLRLGVVNMPNGGASSAQAAFGDGLAALHCFWYAKAAERFRAAQVEDPNFVLAYWGEAMTHDHPIWHQYDLAGGRAVLKRFHERRLTPRNDIERGLVTAVEGLFAEQGDIWSRHEAFRDALAPLYDAHPDDIDIVSFYALAILGTVRAYEGNDDKALAAAGLLEKYLARGDPNAMAHPGMLHYLIHAYDNPRHAARAERAASLYGNVAPDSSHALHMPSHIFLQLGRWPDVVAANDAAYNTSRKWADLEKLGDDGLDFHALYWLLYGSLQQGRYAAARAVLQNARGIVAGQVAAAVHGYVGMMTARYALETEDWTQLDPRSHQTAVDGAVHASCAGTESEHNRVSTLLALGLAAAKRGDSEAVADVTRGMRRLRAEYPADNGGYSQKILSIEEDEINGVLALQQKKVAQGLDRLRRAAQAEAALDPPSGPPFPAKPAVELLGEALVAAGQCQEGLQWFETSLARTPRRTRSLAGAYRAARACKLASSDAYAEQLRSALAQADAQVAQDLGPR